MKVSSAKMDCRISRESNHLSMIMLDRATMRWANFWERGIRILDRISSRSHLISSIFNYILKGCKDFLNFNWTVVTTGIREGD